MLYLLSYLNPWSFSQTILARGDALRVALEKLGPVFVKFGQVLSTRSDLLPGDVVNQLEKLQDQVPPFSGQTAKQIIERELNKPLTEVFTFFDPVPLASASVAQVYAAKLLDGCDVVVKVLRPNIRVTILHDIALMYCAANW